MAQTVFVIRATRFQASVFDQAKNKWTDWNAWIDTDILITLDGDNDLVKIANMSKDSFKLLDVRGRDSGTDSDGDSWNATKYRSVDKEGKSLELTLQIFDRGLYIITIRYSDSAWRYAGKRISFE